MKAIADFYPSWQGKHPLLIAGPCGAESPEQMRESARSAAGAGADMIRAGIWKPRTRPGSFEGRGGEALRWLKEAGLECSLPVCVEVANPSHVEQALQAGIDCLWLGARTTVNPFLVQDIVNALKGVDIPVFVKNPVNPDLELWIGAIERVLAGSHSGKVAAIHRGFSSYENKIYRNKPNWEIPIELRRRMPGIPILCDPSHICGSKALLSYVAQLALDLQYDGLMIETHWKPETALSDAAQQLNADELKNLIAGLVVRKKNLEDPFELSRLEDLRDQMDELDAEIVAFLGRRMQLAREIGLHKYRNQIAILQPERWDEVIRTRSKMGKHHQLSEEFILALLDIVHQESIQQQNAVMEKQKEEEQKAPLKRP